MVSTRLEYDSMGAIEVPAERLWGAQTERSRRNFTISGEPMPQRVITALAHVKRAAALTNAELGLLDAEVASAIARAADEVIAGQHDVEFPLVVWQTGSGTQSHMNVNEVLANRASELLGGERGSARLVHPNDHVNLGQSSNDVFSAALGIAASTALLHDVLPRLGELTRAFADKAERYADLVKIGRTHLQDATPLTLGQEISGWVAQLEHAARHLESALPHLSELPLGGTAVGTGLNAHPELAERAIARLRTALELELCPSPNKFEGIAAHDAVVFAHGAIEVLATALIKIANDVRWLGSGPRAGLGELRLPANEPGSSIMPGKVNPTQCEALLMCCMQVVGNGVAVRLAGSSGNFQLNVCKPLLVYDFLFSCRLLADGMDSFTRHLVLELEPDAERIRELLERSLMLVTALTPHLGYDAAAQIAKTAHAENLSLREAALRSGLLSAEDFDRWVRPELMVSPSR